MRYGLVFGLVDSVLRGSQPGSDEISVRLDRMADEVSVRLDGTAEEEIGVVVCGLHKTSAAR